MYNILFGGTCHSTECVCVPVDVCGFVCRCVCVSICVFVCV